jgi:hypothetical protein
MVVITVSCVVVVQLDWATSWIDDTLLPPALQQGFATGAFASSKKVKMGTRLIDRL